MVGQKLRIPLEHRHQQHAEVTDGGVISYAADSVLTFAAGAAVGRALLTAGYSISFLAPGVGDELIAKPRLTGFIDLLSADAPEVIGASRPHHRPPQRRHPRNPTVPPPSSPSPTPPPHIRIARPTNDLPAAERFYASGLGLDVLWRSQNADLMAVGWPAAAWHLELVHDPQVTPRPTVEDLLVLYLGQQPDHELVARLRDHGGTQVAAHNPYWDTHGVTIRDPDGYRLVLSHRTWNPTG